MAQVGWMPVVSGNGVMFTLCSGIGTQQMVAGQDAAPTSSDTFVDAGACDFAGMGTPALPDVPAEVARAIFAIFIGPGPAHEAPHGLTGAVFASIAAQNNPGGVDSSTFAPGEGRAMTFGVETRF